jgi:chromosome segregation ATPase
MRELEAAKNRNAWYAAELTLARKAGYQPNSSGNPILDQQAADVFGDDDRPLIEAFLRMRSELTRIQGSMDAQAEQFASRVAEIERQRDAAVSEAVYAKARFAAQGGGGSGDGTLQQFDMPRGTSASPDVDRVNEISKRLAAALTQQQELKVQFEQLSAESEAERKARMLAEEGVDAAQKRVSELEAYRQRDATEVESLRSQLHESQRVARESEVACAEALASSRSIEMEHRELSGLRDVHLEELKRQAQAFQKLQEALKASIEKADSFEQKHGEEQERSVSLEQKHAQLRSDHEKLVTELESTQRRLHDAEEFGNKHAAEARTHREVVISGLDSLSLRNTDMEEQVLDERVNLLQQQLETANTIIQKRQAEVDSSADRLRVAEERIAGLEAYQEQSSRESLAIRKQLQQSLREGREIQQEKNEVMQSLERAQLEKNALEVQYKTLKNLLDERGISPSDVRRSRGLDSPTTRYGTPELNKIRELERQLDEALKAHEELRLSYEQREQEVSREWEEKLAALDNDHQGAVKYVRGLEKMLAKMKQELQKTKSANMELEKEIVAQKAVAAMNAEAAPPQEWQAEREQLRSDMAAMQDNLKASVGALESQIRTLNASLADAHQQRDDLSKVADDARQRHDATVSRLAQSTREIEAMRQENALLLARATDAEGKVQLFLDQFESSVDNYRRRSRTAAQNRTVHGEGSRPNGVRHGAHESISGASLYSTTTTGDDDDDDDDDDEDDGTSTGSGRMTPNANVGLPHGFPTVGFASGVDVTVGGEGVGQTGGKHARDRSSTALDSLANELDALRTRWETTNKSYRLSDKFEFDRSPLTPTLGMGAGLGLGVGSEEVNKDGERVGMAGGEGNGRDISLANWRRRLEEDDDGDKKAVGESSLGSMASTVS